MIDSLRDVWENLSEREQRLVGLMGVVVLAMVIATPFYLLYSSIGDLEKENAEIARTLREIGRSRARLALQRAERDRADARYQTRAPSLNTFLENQAETSEDVRITDVQREPERQDGRFRVRHSRARLQGADLRQAIEMLASIKNSRYPISIERIHVDHAASNYNFQVGVLAFDRPDEGGDDDEAEDEEEPEEGGRRRAGPPPPR